MRRLAFPLGLLALLATACADHGLGEPLGEVSEATQVCPMTVVEGVDVYDGQGAIDWASVHADQRLFAFVKATQGNYNDQTTFASDWSGTKSAGIIRSPYHFFDPTIDGVAQAQYFLTVLSAQGGLKPGDLPPMLDIECPTSSNQGAANPNCEYAGNSGWVATATLSQRVFDWLNTVEQATGRKPIIYSYPSWFSDVGFTDAQLAQYPLFIATYASCASVPAPWTTTVFWQYSSSGTVTGINGQVDVDRFLGTDAELIAFANGAAADAGVEGGAKEGGAGDGGANDGGKVDASDSGGDANGTGKDAAAPGDG